MHSTNNVIRPIGFGFKYVQQKMWSGPWDSNCMYSVRPMGFTFKYTSFNDKPIKEIVELRNHNSQGICIQIHWRGKAVRHMRYTVNCIKWKMQSGQWIMHLNALNKKETIVPRGFSFKSIEQNLSYPLDSNSSELNEEMARLMGFAFKYVQWKNGQP